MFKRGMLVGGGLLLMAMLFFGRDAVSYLTTTAGWMSRSVRESVPVKFELERARKMIASLEPEIGRHKRDIAREELELRRIEEQINSSRETLADTWEDIQRLREDLARGDSNFVYSGRTYSARQVETDLTNRFERYETREATVANLEQILQARERGLAAAQDKLQAMIAAKRQLEVQVENLEARLKMVEVAKTASELRIDDSQLSRTRELLSDLEARIEVDARLVNADDYIVDEIRLDDPDAEARILDRISEYEASRSKESPTYVGLDLE